jgi:hypothetical protein
MSDILFKTPIYIGGKEVILVNDIAGTPSTDSSAQHSYISVSRADKETPSLFVFEDDIISLRAEFPTLPIFGIWQLVFNNGLIDWSVNHYWIEASVASGPVISRNS